MIEHEEYCSSVCKPDDKTPLKQFYWTLVILIGLMGSLLGVVYAAVGSVEKTAKDRFEKHVLSQADQYTQIDNKLHDIRVQISILQTKLDKKKTHE
jgi:hypothetical protein